ncbi:8228_t:CDS:2 [Entrophospora sp. SA101]|nr:8228_t:CDS:2 [Entrophospora sp. SA101]
MNTKMTKIVTEFLKGNRVTIPSHPDLAHVTCHISYNKKESGKLDGRKSDKVEKLVCCYSVNYLVSCKKKLGNEWNKIIFSDESRFLLFQNDSNDWVWRIPGERYKKEYLSPTVKKSDGIMVWGCFTRKMGLLVRAPNESGRVGSVVRPDPTRTFKQLTRPDPSGQRVTD